MGMNAYRLGPGAPMRRAHANHAGTASTGPCLWGIGPMPPAHGWPAARTRVFLLWEYFYSGPRPPAPIVTPGCLCGEEERPQNFPAPRNFPELIPKKNPENAHTLAAGARRAAGERRHYHPACHPACHPTSPPAPQPPAISTRMPQKRRSPRPPGHPTHPLSQAPQSP